MYANIFKYNLQKNINNDVIRYAFLQKIHFTARYSSCRY